MKPPSRLTTALTLATSLTLGMAAATYAVGGTNSPADTFAASGSSAASAYQAAIAQAQKAYDDSLASGGNLYVAGDRFNQDANAARDAFTRSVNEAQNAFNGTAYTQSGGTPMAASMGTFRTHLQGDQEVPPVTTPAYGEFMATYDPAADTLSYALSAYNLTGLTMAHLQMADPGSTGPAVAPLTLTVSGSATQNGEIAKGTISPADLTGPMAGMTVKDLAMAMRGNMVYVTVHTDAHPDGEIRGHVMMQ